MSKNMGMALMGLGLLLLGIGFSTSSPALLSRASAFPPSSDHTLWVLVGGGFSTAMGTWFLMARAR